MTVNDPEINAMAAVLDALKDLEVEQQNRVLTWASQRLSLRVKPETSGEHAAGNPDSEATSENAGNTNPASTREKKGLEQFSDLAELYSAVDPRTDVDRVLVGASWLARTEQRDFNAAEVNRLLKDLGYGIKSITDAFDSLQERRPQLVIQVRKSGSSAQARKLYRVTQAGVSHVLRLAHGLEE